jgi:uncharacterized coiled-coil DUF342 family protein
MTEQEQNKKINELNRRVAKLEAALKTIDLDLEPSGRISNSFDAIEDHLEQQDKKFDQQDKKFDQLQYDLNQANGKLDAILDRLTGLSDLPEE